MVIGTLALVKKSMEHHLERIPGKININELKNITLTTRNSTHTKKVPAYSLNYCKEPLIPQAKALGPLLEDYKNHFKRARTY